LTENTVAAVARVSAFEQLFVRSEQSTIETASTQSRIKEYGNLPERKRPCASTATSRVGPIGKKKSWLANNASQLSGFYALTST